MTLLQLYSSVRVDEFINNVNNEKMVVTLSYMTGYNVETNSIINVIFLWSLKIRVLALNLMTEDGSKRYLRNIDNYVLICEALRYKSLQ